MIASFKQLVIKLNEAAFKPIFRRIYDWAYANDGGLSELRNNFSWISLSSSADIRKKVTFNCLFASLLDYFKVGYPYRLSNDADKQRAGVNDTIHVVLATTHNARPESLSQRKVERQGLLGCHARCRHKES